MAAMRGLAAAALGALVALAAAATATAAAAGPGARAEALLPPFELDEVLNGSFTARGLGAVWVSPTVLARRSDAGDLEQYDAAASAPGFTVLVSRSVLSQGGRNLAMGTWQLSSDLKALLWSYDVKAGYRHSTEAKYSVLDIEKSIWHDLHASAHLQTAQLSPQGDSVAYVFENNVYYVGGVLALAGTQHTGVAITEDGSHFIYNGVPDWVYEEEVLSSGSAMWFSPGGTYLAHAKFNDEEVGNFSYIIYGDQPYSKVETLLYPKPGTTNPTVQVDITDLSSKTTITVSHAATGYDDPILQHVAWTSDQQVLVVWLNRIQNDVSFVQYSASDASAEPHVAHKDSEGAGWLDVGLPRAVNDSAWALLYPQRQAGGERVAKVVQFVGGEPLARVLGDGVASAFYGWDATRRRLFFQAAPAGQPAQRQVFWAADGGSGAATCLSCALQQGAGGAECLHASAAFSPDLQRAVVTCSGPGPAVVRLAQISSTGAVSWQQGYLLENHAVLDRLEQRSRPRVVADITFNVGTGLTAQARLWLPPALDKTKKYPMLVYVYGGPGSQQVSNAYSVNWGHFLATNRSIIYAAIDGRGSGFQGTRMLYALYKRLGTAEVEDQIAGVKHLLATYSFIDKERVGIWGWSYGGYATAMALARDGDGVFRCGASVAPVTDWTLYDSIYTERYMDVPDANREGYERANVSDKIDNFKKHRFFLLHGNADDNVHYQQAMRLARALELGDVLFAQQSYPDENHSIRSVLRHVYRSMGVFFDECFAAPAPGGAPAPRALLLALLLPAAALLL